MNLVTSAQKFPDRIALRMDDQAVTYAHLDEATARLAQMMSSLGIGQALAPMSSPPARAGPWPP
jgi:non-ribosomal peptide synthetase component E (peptide arylation enzyme)